MVSKLGIGALAVGLLILLAEWFLFFAPKAGTGALTGVLMAFLAYLLIGGLLWLGIILIVIGILILII
ncbi:MAG: hypothetical protein V1817_04820 [Candidatus Micrarchaeota archaeon]